LEDLLAKVRADAHENAEKTRYMHSPGLPPGRPVKQRSNCLKSGEKEVFLAKSPPEPKAQFQVHLSRSPSTFSELYNIFTTPIEIRAQSDGCFGGLCTK
jgi:hypothetical protein